MKRIYCFTSAACNYLPKTRLLVESLRKHHPEFRCVLGLSDLPGTAPLAETGWDEVLPMSDLGIPDWRRWAFCHDIVELSTAIKPFVLRNLLQRPDCEAVFYFDPDIVLFSRLDDLIALFERGDLLLTPHQTIPEATTEAVVDNEICSLRHGVYNLGFIGVQPSAQGHAFAEWWSRRVYDFCRKDIPNGLFTDQRWIDLAPAFFPGVHVVRSSRFNVAPWNLTTRRVGGSLRDGVTVDGQPLGFYHFTGFDSGAHGIMAGKYGADSAAVQELVAWYRRGIDPLDHDPRCRLPWAFGAFSNGGPINRAQRVVYRTRPDLQATFPDPFATDSGGRAGYLGWCRRHGRFEYPGFLPEPKANADWSKLGTPPQPTLASAAAVAPHRSLREHLRLASGDRRYARELWAQARRVSQREGFAGVWRRFLRLMT
ncbi:MAG: glycosyl transferase [Pseudomonadota bacterium]